MASPIKPLARGPLPKKSRSRPNRKLRLQVVSLWLGPLSSSPVLAALSNAPASSSRDTGVGIVPGQLSGVSGMRVISNKDTCSDRRANKLLGGRFSRLIRSHRVSHCDCWRSCLPDGSRHEHPQFFHDLHDNTVYFVGWISHGRWCSEAALVRMARDNRALGLLGYWPKNIPSAAPRGNSPTHTHSSARRTPPASRTRPARKTGAAHDPNS